MLNDCVLNYKIDHDSIHQFIILVLFVFEDLIVIQSICVLLEW